MEPLIGYNWTRCNMSNIDTLILETQDNLNQTLRVLRTELIARYNKILELENRIKELEAKNHDIK